MLAARDQENLIHRNQTTATGKALNQGLRGLQPKTPGNRAPKTPFQGRDNDENRPRAFNGQKSALEGLAKGDENTLQATKEPKLKDNAFITPVAPRPRAPLGAKTTNIRTHAFRSPAPARQAAKPGQTITKLSTIRKSARPKVTIASSEPIDTDLLALGETDQDVPDIEYAPPPPVELPDLPEDVPYDSTFPQLQGANLCRGWQDYFTSPKDESGMSLRLKKYEEQCRLHDEEASRKMLASLEEPLILNNELEDQVAAMIAAGPKKDNVPPESKVDAVRARSAAKALSQIRVPNAAPRPTTKSRQTSKKPAFSVHSAIKTPLPTNPSSMRHTAAKAVSNNTIGFPKARAPPSILPPKPRSGPTVPKPTNRVPVDQSEIRPRDFLDLYGEPPVGSEMWYRIHASDIFDKEAEEETDQTLADGFFGTNFFPPIEDEEEKELFQLPIP